MSEKNIVWHQGYVETADFEARNGYPGAVLWFTGLSASGKSTLCRELQWRLFKAGKQAVVLDGDNVRHGLNKDLGFSPYDRVENIRRVGEVAKLLRQNGAIVLTAFISPYRRDRQMVRELFTDGSFHEIYVQCSVDACIRRDPKGLYKKALAGMIPDFTGVSAPYEEPEAPELVVPTENLALNDSLIVIENYLQSKGWV